ncbi:beige/BEACH domain protein (macronuclear) [Tetrahymena thermophila SB210]|uniref:Beige/BEACH domain protein n=1 Tax=Tetrahymena thermophila (strain SB210) TaxID=312017 RepID=Q22LM1_TETTS|nr:beige/BEACH domain protein [Tetrahymena thermophila SB210]EAR86245.2 beige/BEACH domain protein [Tetrahymena thermophila SB210]|eukprot:XP_976840.2 beige/BEACH domain protein [Tetrahymena thermophila SB210]
MSKNILRIREDWVKTKIKEIHTQEKRIQTFQQSELHQERKSNIRYDLIKIFVSDRSIELESKYFPIVNAITQENDKYDFLLTLLLLIADKLDEYLNSKDQKSSKILINIIIHALQKAPFVKKKQEALDIVILALEIVVKINLYTLKNPQQQQVDLLESDDEISENKKQNSQQQNSIIGNQIVEEQNQEKQKNEDHEFFLQNDLAVEIEENISNLITKAHIELLKQFELMESVDKISAQKLYYYLNFVLLYSPFNEQLFTQINKLYLLFYENFCQICNSFLIKFEESFYYALDILYNAPINALFLSLELAKFYQVYRKVDRIEQTIVILLAFFQKGINKEGNPGYSKDLNEQLIQEVTSILTEVMVILPQQKQEDMLKQVISFLRIAKQKDDFLFNETINIFNKLKSQFININTNLSISLMCAIAENDDTFILNPSNQVWKLEEINEYAIIIKDKSERINANSSDLTFLLRLFYFYTKVYEYLNKENELIIIKSYEQTIFNKSASIFSYEKIAHLILTESFSDSKKRLFFMIVGIMVMTFRERKECRMTIQNVIIKLLNKKQDNYENQFEMVKYSFLCNMITNMYQKISQIQIYNAQKQYKLVQFYQYDSPLQFTMVFDKDLVQFDLFIQNIYEKLCVIATVNNDPLLLKEILCLTQSLQNKGESFALYSGAFKKMFLKLMPVVTPFHLNQILIFSTRGEYFPIYEKLFQKQVLGQNLLIDDDYQLINKTFDEVYFDKMSFIQINESNFLDVYIKYLEKVQDNQIKKYFLNVVYALAKNSFENTIFLSKPKVFQNIVSCLAKEQNQENRKLFLNLAQVILSEGVSAHHVKSITQQILNSQQDKYFCMLHESIRLLEDIINEQNSPSHITPYYYFKGRDSILMLDEKIPFVDNCSKGFSVLACLKLESVANFYDSSIMIKDVQNILYKANTSQDSSLPSTADSLKKNKSSDNFDPQPKQCLFCFVSKDDKKLVVYIIPGQSNKKAILRICFIQDSISIDIDFDYGNFSECSKWHILQINYSEKNGSEGFTVAFNGIVKQPISNQNRRYGKYVDNFKVLKQFSIGAEISPAKNCDNFVIEGSFFNGFINQLYIFNESIQIERTKIKLQEYLTEMYYNTNLREKIILKLNTEKNTLSKQNEGDQNLYSSLDRQNSKQNCDRQCKYHIQYGDNRDENIMLEAPICLTFLKQKRKLIKQSFLNMFKSDDISVKTEFPHYKIVSRGIRFLEFSHFLEALLSIGNIEIFIYILDLIIGNKELNSEQKMTIASAVFQLMSVMIQQDQEIIMYFDQNSKGMHTLKMLIKAIVKENKGCSIQFLESFKQFIEIGFPYQECNSTDFFDDQADMTWYARQVALQEIFFCYQIWGQCSFKIQRSVYVFILSFLEMDNETFDTVFRIVQNESLVPLFEVLQNNFNEKQIRTENNENDCKELRDLKGYLLKIINNIYTSAFIKNEVQLKRQDYKSLIELLLKNICYAEPGQLQLDLVRILQKIFNAKTPVEVISIIQNKEIESLEQIVVAILIHTCTMKQGSQQNREYFYDSDFSQQVNHFDELISISVQLLLEYYLKSVKKFDSSSIQIIQKQIQNLDSILPQYLHKETITILIEYLNKSLIEKWRIEKTIMEILFTRVPHLEGTQQIMVIKDIKKVLGILYNRHINALNKDQIDEDFKQFLHKLVINPQFIQIVENILYINFEDEESLKIVQDSSQEILDYIINFLIWGEIDGAKLIQQLIQSSIHEYFEKFIHILQLQLTQVNSKDSSQILLATQKYNLIELFFYVENIVYFYPNLISNQEAIYQKVIHSYIEFFGNNILCLENSSPQIKKELEGQIDLNATFNYLEKIVMHKLVLTNGGVLRSVIDTIFVSYRNSTDIGVKNGYLQDLNIFLMRDVGNSQQKEQKLFTESETINLIEYRNEFDRNIFTEYFKDYILTFALQEYFVTTNKTLKDSLYKLIYNSYYDKMQRSWSSFDTMQIGNYQYNLQISPYENLQQFLDIFNNKIEVKIDNNNLIEEIQDFFVEVKELRNFPNRNHEKLKDILESHKNLFLDQIIPIIDNYIGVQVQYVRHINGIFYKLREQVFQEAKREKINIFYSIHSQSASTKLKQQQIIDTYKQLCEDSFQKYYQLENEQLIETAKVWKSKKKRLVSERGLWFEENSSEKIKWKINKVEDRLRRKFFLKRDKKWLDKKFFTDPKYQKQQILPSKQQQEENDSSKKQFNLLGSFENETDTQDLNQNLAIQKDQSLIEDKQPTIRQVQSTLIEDPASIKRNQSSKQLEKDSSQQPMSPQKNEEVIIEQFDFKNNVQSASSKIRSSSFNNSQKIVENNMIDLICEAEQVTQTGVVYGILSINQKGAIIFSSKDQRIKPNIFGCIDHQLIQEQKTKVINVKNVKLAISRRYLFQEIAFELFTDDQKVIFFNVYKPQIKENFLSIIKRMNENCNVVINRKLEFQKSGIKDDWKKGRITNFDYLMQLNTYSGRSFNDLSQYPVFPWIIRDYKSSELKLEEDSFYRPLNQPIGAINRNRFLDHFYERFQHSSPKDRDTYFMYGTHYSNATIVLTLLMRMEPFAGLHFTQQSNKFDHADRLFHSIHDQWESGQLNSADVKELIPEFYYLPDFLYNVNELFLGKKQDNTEVDRVILPEWIKRSTDTPEEFVFRMRQALESPFVSKNLHSWIDLIFGSKQIGQKAIDNENLFHPSSYAENFNIKGLDEAQILAEKAKVIYFGQTPFRLFDEDQKPRDDSGLITMPKIKEFEFYNKITPKYQKVCQESSLEYVTANNRYVGLMERDLNKFYFNIFKCKTSILEKDFTYRRGKIEIKKSPEISFRNSVLLYRTFILSVAHGDKNIIVKNFKDEKYEAQINSLHKKIITCMDVCEEFIVCGSRDCRLSVYSVGVKQNILKNFLRKEDIEIKHLRMIYGHHNEISAVKLDQTLLIIVSIDMDGLGLIHELKTMRFLHSFKLPDLQDSECVQFLEIHQCGFILIVTNQKRLFIFTMNGNLYSECSFSYISNQNEEKITDVKFLSSLSSFIYLSTNKGVIYYLDLFEIKAKQIQNMTPAFSKFQPNSEHITSIYFHYCKNLIHKQNYSQLEINILQFFIQKKSKITEVYCILKEMEISVSFKKKTKLETLQCSQSKWEQKNTQISCLRIEKNTLIIKFNKKLLCKYINIYIYLFIILFKHIIIFFIQLYHIYFINSQYYLLQNFQNFIVLNSLWKSSYI